MIHPAPIAIFFFIIFVTADLFRFYASLAKDPHNDSQFAQQISPTALLAEAKSKQVDCTKTPRYCGSKSDCQTLCEPPATLNTWLDCDIGTGACKITRPAADKSCNESLGSFNALVQTELSWFWTCINTKPHIFDDNGQPLENVCGTRRQEGHLNSATMECVCVDGTEAMIHIYKPDVSVCLPTKAKHLFPSFQARKTQVSR